MSVFAPRITPYCVSRVGHLVGLGFPAPPPASQAAGFLCPKDERSQPSMMIVHTRRVHTRLPWVSRAQKTTLGEQSGSPWIGRTPRAPLYCRVMSPAAPRSGGSTGSVNLRLEGTVSHPICSLYGNPARIRSLWPGAAPAGPCTVRDPVTGPGCAVWNGRKLQLASGRGEQAWEGSKARWKDTRATAGTTFRRRSRVVLVGELSKFPFPYLCAPEARAWTPLLY